MANTPNINLVKPLGTDRALVSVINDNSDKIDAFAGSTNTNMANTQNGYAIVVDGNNAPKAITAGQYLFIKNHSTLSAGGYHATANIANGAAITSSNVAADADGVVNGAFSALNSKIGTKETGTFTLNSSYSSNFTIARSSVYRFEKMLFVNLTLEVTSDLASGEKKIGTISILPEGQLVSPVIKANDTTSLGVASVGGNGNVYINSSISSGVQISLSFAGKTA